MKIGTDNPSFRHRYRSPPRQHCAACTWWKRYRMCQSCFSRASQAHMSLFHHCTSFGVSAAWQVAPKDFVKRYRWHSPIAPLLWLGRLFIVCITFKLSDAQPFPRLWDFSACKVSASGIPQGHSSALAHINFQDFGVRLLLNPKSRTPEGENLDGYPLPPCLLLALFLAA